jgi:hypothetical protein
MEIEELMKPFPFTVTLSALIFAGTAASLPLHLSAQVSQQEASTWVEETLAGLTLEKKIGQLICSDITGDYVAEGDQDLERWVELARDYGLGMFVLYGGTPRDVAHLLNRLQREAEIPILMAADFEGGPGQQVRGASEFPANMAFAAAGSEDLVYRATSAAAVEGRAMGIHLTYTPVVDIAWRPENPAESVRSFGGNLELLGRLVRAYVRGYHENGMLASGKHFPGRGDIETMPDRPPWIWLDKPAEACRCRLRHERAHRGAVDYRRLRVAGEPGGEDRERVAQGQSRFRGHLDHRRPVVRARRGTFRCRGSGG